MTNVGVQIELGDPDAFLKIKESLTRIGVASGKDRTLYQSAHILHKRGEYFIVMFKELFLLDGKSANITESDIKRRNLIAWLLQDWGLCKIKDQAAVADRSPINSVKILPYQEKSNWTLVTKYSLGTR